jgi:hypothetical protein
MPLLVMKKIYYIKQGRRYVPVAEYDQDLMSSFPKGVHIVMSYPGGQSTRYSIEPAYGPMIAAGRVAEDAMCKAMMDASELKPQQTPLTEGQRRAWRKLAREFGKELCTLQGASTRDIVEAGVQAMQAEADKLMQHPAVRDAYEQFQLVCKLVMEKDNGNN